MKAALFDLDRTLIDVNSASLWMRHEWDAGNLGVRDVAWGAWWIAKYSLGLGAGMDDAYEQAVATLAGKSEEDVDARTRRWFDEMVRDHLRPGAKEALAQHREAGDRLVVATSSSPYAARAAADAYGLDEVISTRYEVVDGVFTGRVEAPAYGDGKAERIAEWAQASGLDLAEATLYTDSMTDLAALELVGHPVAVNPDRRLAAVAAERGWPIVDWGAA